MGDFPLKSYLQIYQLPNKSRISSTDMTPWVLNKYVLWRLSNCPEGNTVMLRSPRISVNLYEESSVSFLLRIKDFKTLILTNT